MQHRVALASALVGLAACAGKPAETPAPPPAAPVAPAVVTIGASDHAFTGPDTITAGVVTIRLTNAGPSPHHVQLVKLGEGKTFADLMGALKNPGPPPAWAALVAGPNSPMPPADTSSATLTLDAGHYALICLVPDQKGVPHFALGMAKPVEVVPAAGPVAAEPASDMEVALTDYAFSLPDSVAAGAHVIKITNNGQQPHEMLIVRLEQGAKAAAIAHWVEGKMQGPPPGVFKLMGGVAGMMPGAHSLANVTLTAGTYALLCFAPDMKDGKEHTQHGMLREFKVN